MTTILIPTDFSENSWNAIMYALSFFKNRKCTFYLLYVNGENGIGHSSPAASNIEDKKRLQALINKIEASPLKQKHIFFSLVSQGNIVDAIRDEVTDKHIDLIVMGTKGNSGIKKNAVGSNTTDVINKVKCSTLVIPEYAKFSSIDTIALPTDYNIFYGPKILETISGILKMFQAKIYILHLAKKNEVIINEQFQNKELLKDYFSDNESRFLSVTNKNLGIAIQECTDKHQIKLIAMAAKNIHFFQQLLFSSNQTNPAYLKEIPFLVLHE